MIPGLVTGGGAEAHAPLAMTANAATMRARMESVMREGIPA
jgi:hypothetical protein